jgi:capsular polysaccharide biosynthesis protein
MEIREYLNVLRRRVWIPLLLMIVAVFSTGAVIYLAKPDYSATATVLARTGTNTSQTLSFSDVATSNTLALRVLRKLNLSENVDSLAAQITITASPGNLYKITVRDASSRRAEQIANTAAAESTVLYGQLAGGNQQSIVDALATDRNEFKQQYIAAAKAALDYRTQHPDAFGPNAIPKDTAVGAQALQLQLEQQATGDAYNNFWQAIIQTRVTELAQVRGFSAVVVDQAAAKPDSSGGLLKVIYAGVLALVLGIGLMFALEYFDNSVREPEEVEQLVGAPVVGIIPRGTARTLRPVHGGI